MLVEYKTKTNITIAFAILLFIISRVFSTSDLFLAPVGGAGLFDLFSKIFLLGSLILFVFGCYFYAKGKGYSGDWALLGLLGIVGLIILIFFPDRHKRK
jgi:hypothetical protein